MMATAVAHANLAFVKYWGKRDAALNIPLNNSISMNLSEARTTTSVEFDTTLANDRVELDGAGASEGFSNRVSRHLDRLRALADSSAKARVATHNSFPASTGFASSASGFAALTLAAAAALDLSLSERALSILARQGSGSACRSIPTGFVEWQAGSTDSDSYAESIAAPDHWDLVDIAVLVTESAKQVPSSQGHLLALNSPFWEARQVLLPDRLARVRKAILERDFYSFGCEIEAEAMAMHAIMLTSAYAGNQAWHSGIYYISPDTLELLIAVQRWRDEGLEVYFTLDAGPTVHLMCPGQAASEVVAAVDNLARPDWSIIKSAPARGAYLLPD
jgi:diphosphomevalonate decarboxylase